MEYEDLSNGGAVIILTKKEASQLAEELFRSYYVLPKRGMMQRIYDLLAHVRA